MREDLVEKLTRIFHQEIFLLLDLYGYIAFWKRWEQKNEEFED